MRTDSVNAFCFPLHILFDSSRSNSYFVVLSLIIFHLETHFINQLVNKWYYHMINKDPSTAICTHMNDT
jgi:hypothetical protein